MKRNLLPLVVLSLMVLFLVAPAFADNDAAPLVGCAIGGFIMLVSLAIWGYMMFWLYKDTQARGENTLLWMVIVFFTGLIGLVIYLVVRKKE